MQEHQRCVAHAPGSLYPITFVPAGVPAGKQHRGRDTADRPWSVGRTLAFAALTSLLLWALLLTALALFLS